MKTGQKVKKVAFITGVTGQDGAYLAQYLVEHDYEVHGLVRRSSVDNTSRLYHFYPPIITEITLHTGDLNEWETIQRILREVKPDEIYNLAAMSFVGASFDLPLTTAYTNGLAVVNILEYIRNYDTDCRMYQASTSEMFGESTPPQSELTRFNPRSPYGTAKAFAHHSCVNYREAYDLHISCGILFNHESPLRGDEFVTKKITNGLNRILDEYVYPHTRSNFVLELGNVDARRDWGHAEDYVRAMHLMLQQDKGDDYVVATGESYSVRDFLEQSFLCIRKKYPEFPDISFKGKGENFTASCADSGDTIVKVNPKFYRPSEVNYLLGDPTKAREKLGWEPRFSLEDIVSGMMMHD
jgi:GDPmannose 4,6-dehydratase|tara:strand:- start:667 stop:1728 length:1062 start_codon:yes stop_codon:yes gene_type:complete